jgi:hypothetical protein
MSCKHFENPAKTDKSDIVAAMAKTLPGEKGNGRPFHIRGSTIIYGSDMKM